uniref:hypothetical protein n=1 Tax=Pseudomonas aeruginosa TaxID=287 RepID=UPI002355E734|nr:hypothetical protein [Pseudomonas aeruginosa]
MEQTSPPEMLCQFAERALSFLRDIGLSVEVVPGAAGFIDHVRIKDGGLQIDPRCPASGLLHEAGHLAVVPKRYRHWMSGNLYASFNRMLKDPEFLAQEPDSPLYRAVIQATDPEVTAWAWAAGRFLGIPSEVIIQNDEYDGSGRNIRILLQANSYIGINGLSHGGFCVRRKTPYRALPQYPELAFWLQP